MRGTTAWREDEKEAAFEAKIAARRLVKAVSFINKIKTRVGEVVWRALAKNGLL